VPTRLMLFIVAVIVAAAAGPPAAQAQPDTAMVAVDGGVMRAQTRGIRERRPGQAIVILEAGAGSGLDTWAPIIDGVAAFAPVVAYDRRGLGRSALDNQPQTLRRAATSLHMLLAAIDAPPPYVLVGHSYGGVIIRAFAQQFGSEVSGLVYLDVPDIDLTYAEADQLGPTGRQVAFSAPAIPQTAPAGLRAEFENIAVNLRTEFAEAREARPAASLPSAVVISTQRSWNGATPEMTTSLLRLAIQHQQEWALSTPRGMLVVAGHVGHFVHRDDPDLVLRLIRHVLASAPTTR
jgi:pimeloyl-ACP methyl ester carboxylesterase